MNQIFRDGFLSDELYLKQDFHKYINGTHNDFSHIDLSYSIITISSFCSLMEKLTNQKMINSLTLTGCFVIDDDPIFDTQSYEYILSHESRPIVEDIFEKFLSSSSLTHIDMTYSQYYFIMPVLNTTFRNLNEQTPMSLNLSLNHLDNHIIGSISTFLNSNPIQKINFDKNEIRKIFLLKKQLKRFKLLSEISILNNSFNELEVNKIIDMLKECKHIKKFLFWDNKFNLQSHIKMADMIKDNDSLIDIGLKFEHESESELINNDIDKNESESESELELEPEPESKCKSKSSKPKLDVDDNMNKIMYRNIIRDKLQKNTKFLL
jgi:hypothetical protein